MPRVTSNLRLSLVCETSGWRVKVDALDDAALSLAVPDQTAEELGCAVALLLGFDSLLLLLSELFDASLETSAELIGREAKHAANSG